MTKLYVGNLPYSTTNQQLSDMFAAYGNVLSATIIMDRNTGRSKGFGFVELEDDTQAQNAISTLNGSQIEERTIVVSVARPREDRPQNGGGSFQNRGRGNDRRGGHSGGRGDWGNRR